MLIKIETYPTLNTTEVQSPLPIEYVLLTMRNELKLSQYALTF